VTQIGLGTSSTDSSKLKLNYTYGVLVNGVLDATRDNGNLQSQTLTLPGLVLTQSYTYDELNRLKSAQEMNGVIQVWKQTFSYDRFGNRRFDAANTTLPQITLQNETSTNPAISSANNRISTAGYRYDLAGNLECDPTHPCGSTTPFPAYYQFDGDNRILTANGGAASGGSTYLYDGDGRRVKKIIGGPTPSTTVFVYDIAGHMIAEYSDQQPTGGGTSYLTADHLGTPRVITRADRSVSGRHDYQPFGEEIPASYGGRASLEGYPPTDGLRQQFTQKERDVETGLDYFFARYYSSTQGRFVTTDQFDGNPSRLSVSFDSSPSAPYANLLNPQTLNLYAYVLNDPLSNVDEDGHQGGRKQPLPGNTRYQIRPDLRNPNDSPNIHVFDRGGRREIGRVAIRPGGNEWTGKVPESVKANVEEYIRVRGIQPRLPGQPLQPDLPSGNQSPQSEATGGTGGRLLRGTNNSITLLAFILGAINAVNDARDAEANGYYMNNQGQIVITDLGRAAQHYPQGYYLEFGGNLWKPRGGTWVPVDPCGCELELKNGELRVIYKTD